jgi:hypothetical protein
VCEGGNWIYPKKITLSCVNKKVHNKVFQQLNSRRSDQLHLRRRRGKNFTVRRKKAFVAKNFTIHEFAARRKKGHIKE